MGLVAEKVRVRAYLPVTFLGVSSDIDGVCQVVTHDAPIEKPAHFETR
jgi:hypothetical protein